MSALLPATAKRPEYLWMLRAEEIKVLFGSELEPDTLDRYVQTLQAAYPHYHVLPEKLRVRLVGTLGAELGLAFRKMGDEPKADIEA